MNNNKIVPEHYQVKTITEIEHFEEHGERKETLEFRNAKKELEKVEHIGCYVCGTMENRESHHIIERASWNASDLKKVAHMLYNHWDYHGHVKRDFESEERFFSFMYSHYNGRMVVISSGNANQTNPKSYWTCDDTCADLLYNQWILCKKHHRGEGTSAHGSSFATMHAIIVARDGFEASISPKELEEMIKQHHVEKHGNLIIPVEEDQNGK